MKRALANTLEYPGDGLCYLEESDQDYQTLLRYRELYGRGLHDDHDLATVTVGSAIQGAVQAAE